MPDESNADAVLECYRRAAEARQIAIAAADPDTKADFFEVERRWRVLARNFQLEASTERTAAKGTPAPSPNLDSGGDHSSKRAS
jgi:hypothetical protein